MSEPQDTNEAACGRSDSTEVLATDCFCTDGDCWAGELQVEIERLRTLARDAYAAWDNDRDARVGKLLIAMIDEKFSKAYRPDLVANVQIHRLCAAISRSVRVECRVRRFDSTPLVMCSSLAFLRSGSGGVFIVNRRGSHDFSHQGKRLGALSVDSASQSRPL